MKFICERKIRDGHFLSLKFKKRKRIDKYISQMKFVKDIFLIDFFMTKNIVK